MDQVRQYLLSVLAAAIISGIATKFADKQSFASAITKLTIAIFLSVTVISPLVKLQIGEITSYFDTMESSSDEIIAQGQNAARLQTSEIILQKTEAYILDKAASLGIEVSVSAKISDPETMVPDSVVLVGTASPYTKKLLQKCIAEDLGIPEENQIWT